MFICRIFLRPGPRLVEMLRLLSSRYPELKSLVDPDNHYIEFRGVTQEAVSQIESFLRSLRLDFDVVIDEECTDAELESARYVPLLVHGEYVDVDKDGKAINRYPKVLCQKCGLVDATVIPNPYLISLQTVRMSQDIYLAHGGILIVSKAAITALGGLFENDAISGKVRILDPGKTRQFADQDFLWIQPKNTLGKELQSKVVNVCDACGGATEIRKVETGNLFDDCRIIVEGCGNHSHAIVMSGSWYGKRTNEQPMTTVRRVFISGRVFALLTKIKVKGLVRPSNTVVCLDC